MSVRRLQKKILPLIALPLMIAALCCAAFFFRHELFSVFRSSQSIRAWVEARGTFGPLAFMALQIVQVIVFVLPGEVVQLAGGFLFGLWKGALWSLLGILAGSVFNFFLGRLLGRPFISAVIGAEKAQRAEELFEGSDDSRKRLGIAFFLLFAIPGIPKDALTYVAGITRLSFASFLCVSTLGRLPGILGSSYMGAAVFDKDYTAALIVSIAAGALFLAGMVFRKPIQRLLSNMLKAGKR